MRSSKMRLEKRGSGNKHWEGARRPQFADQVPVRAGTDKANAGAMLTTKELESLVHARSPLRFFKCLMRNLTISSKNTTNHFQRADFSDRCRAD
jgi:hypothetical protein